MEIVTFKQDQISRLQAHGMIEIEHEAYKIKSSHDHFSQAYTRYKPEDGEIIADIPGGGYWIMELIHVNHIKAIHA